jgi:hypothetical protein
MEIRFLVNGSKCVFRSKSARKKLRDLLKKYSFSDLKQFWGKFKVRCDKYLNENIMFTTNFYQEEILEISFIEYKNEEDKNKELNRLKLRKILADKKNNRKNQGSLNMLKEEEAAWLSDKQANKEEVALYLAARHQDPKRYIPDPTIIKKNPRLYIREYVEYMEFIERVNPNSKLVYEYDDFVIYMCRLLDMEDDINEDEIEI